MAKAKAVEKATSRRRLWCTTCGQKIPGDRLIKNSDHCSSNCEPNKSTKS